MKRVRTIHVSSRQTYGAPRVHAELRAGGDAHGRKRIARLMRTAGLVGASRRRAGVTTAHRDRDARPAPDLVDRNFTAAKANQLWVADITFVPTAAGFLFLAVVLDAWSRKIVGWSMANHLRAELVIDALEMAIGQRRPGAVIHHSDHGSQYTSLAFGSRCQEAGVRPSMGSVGDAYDNAMCESFFATLECELLERRRFATQAEACMTCFSFIEGWYNPVRLHSALGYRSPMAYEAAMERATAEPYDQVPQHSTKAGQLQTPGRRGAVAPPHTRASSRRDSAPSECDDDRSVVLERHPSGVAVPAPSDYSARPCPETAALAIAVLNRMIRAATPVTARRH